ncbi:MAG: hypothetical protein JWR03_2392 [Cohnella sp.]|jgi:hypothetical protein|nr:hypothetical protein [Cohnella sp.]
MNAAPEGLIWLFTNLGFPAALCLILLRYVLLTMGDKLDKLDQSVNTLLRMNSTVGKKDEDNKGAGK